MQRFLIIAAMAALTLPSCVSKKRFTQAEGTISDLRRQNGELNEDISNLKGRLKLMEDANESAASQINEKDKTIGMNEQKMAEQQERMRQLQELIDRQKAKTEMLRENMAKALGGFSSDDLTVFTKNGKVYVSLSENLLFPSGSATVNKEGKEALSKVAEALNQNRDINVNIEGHTDTVPIKLRFEDNWALSLARASAIVRLLTNDYKVDPVRITASGRSQYEPIADNTLPEGRAKNRRTEIILAPKLDELMQLIENKE